MFQISAVKTRYFEFEAPDTRKVLLIEPPKLKTLKRMEDIQKDNQAGISDLAGAIARILSKNKQQRKISGDLVMDWMDIDQMRAFMQSYLGWLKSERSNNPN